ncbi:MAG: nucleotidyltransferase family protein [Firmicutes bacterium]|nr:nucleotidyltransferase family protein [Bacillota bacterium]
MSIVGIVSEYNPLHTGHAHQIQTLKEQGHVVVALMSGNYVQRGTPAVYDKFVRTRMALAAGVSMVIELPTLYSTASAENFAYGAMVLAQKSGIIDAISFGMEDPSYLPFLQRFAILTEPETALFRKALRRYLDIGLSYPHARESAFFELIGELPPEEPNHILALEYLRAARRIGYSPAWLPLQREGADYRDGKIDPLTVSYPSATALRKLLSQGEDIRGYIPEAARAYLPSGYVSEEALLPYIRYVLASLSKEEIAQIDEVAEGLENRLLKYVVEADSYENLVSLLNSSRYPSSRMRRILLNAVLSITRTKKEALRFAEGPLYLRVLGVRKEDTALLSLLTKTSDLPTLIRPVRDRLTLPDTARAAFEEELRFSRIYHTLCPSAESEELKESFILYPEEE